MKRSMMTSFPSAKAGRTFSFRCCLRAAANKSNSVLPSIAVFSGARMISRMDSAIRIPPGSRVVTMSISCFANSGKICCKTVVLPAHYGPSNVIKIPLFILKLYHFFDKIWGKSAILMRPSTSAGLTFLKSVTLVSNKTTDFLPVLISSSIIFSAVKIEAED